MDIIIFQILAIIIDVYIAFSNNKRNILIAVFSYNFLSMLLYFMIKDYTTVYSFILIVSRSFIYLFQNKIKKHKLSFLVPISIMLIHVIVGLRTFESFWNIIPIAAPIIVCYLLWFEKSRQNMRLEQASSDLLWIAYNIHSGLYIICISGLFSIGSGLIAYFKNMENNNLNLEIQKEEG